MRRWTVFEFSSDHVYNWSDCIAGKYIFQPFCLGLVRISSKLVNFKSNWASSRRGGQPTESDSDGCPQPVPFRATLKRPRSNLPRDRLAKTAMLRFFGNLKRLARTGGK